MGKSLRIITHFNHAYAINTLFNFVFDIFPFAAAFCNFYVCILNYFILIFYTCVYMLLCCEVSACTCNNKKMILVSK